MFIMCLRLYTCMYVCMHACMYTHTHLFCRGFLRFLYASVIGVTGFVGFNCLLLTQCPSFPKPQPKLKPVQDRSVNRRALNPRTEDTRKSKPQHLQPLKDAHKHRTPEPEALNLKA